MNQKLVIINKYIVLITCSIIGFYGCSDEKDSEVVRPNVILVITDDQGIGDLSCHGNPWLKTPNIDKFYEDALRLTNFHVSPVCTPTRSALMTGRYPIHNGAWATYKGRDALSEGAVTMAEVFKQNGYRTALFGKWHLGDNYPSRPIDCGFDLAIRHMAGGVGELSDYWGNNYFDDVYFVNGEPQQFGGYCTDVWFQQAMNYMDTLSREPFFTYISTNAPHSPFNVPESYAAPYQSLVGTDLVNAEFYGMIANIDENFGKLEYYLREKNLADNTIVIFMTDNGTSDGISRDGTIGYNMGLRGRKGSREEGGHRVPFFVRWKDGQIEGGQDLNVLAAHIDLLPTLVGLCDLSLPKDAEIDGVDLSQVLMKKDRPNEERTVFIHNRQDWRPPLDIKQSCIMKNQWRLINGDELYDIVQDPEQENNLALLNPALVNDLLSENMQFVEKAKKESAYIDLPANVIGHPDQEEIKLTLQHAIGEDQGIWKTEQIAAGARSKNNKHQLYIEQDGWYEISCRRWPKENPGKLWGIPTKNPKNQFNYKPIRPQKISLRVANQELEREINGDEYAVNFRMQLEKGRSLLENDFIEDGEKYGVYYTYIKKLGSVD